MGVFSLGSLYGHWFRAGFILVALSKGGFRNAHKKFITFFNLTLFCLWVTLISKVIVFQSSQPHSTWGRDAWTWFTPNARVSFQEINPAIKGFLGGTMMGFITLLRGHPSTIPQGSFEKVIPKRSLKRRIARWPCHLPDLYFYPQLFGDWIFFSQQFLTRSLGCVWKIL